MQVQTTKAQSISGNIEARLSSQLTKLRLSAFKRPRKMIVDMVLRRPKLLSRKAAPRRMLTEMSRKRPPSLKIGPYLKDVEDIEEVSIGF